ncbi:MAG: hypothetical protein JXR31_05845 [Prolixibacteraceae bacterium]|nr:hypothetical protein [Prolixibacteraceae bacterium]MBN2773750.1 hypothetical protein [Prolixibacteraceae bacterium]
MAENEVNTKKQKKGVKSFIGGTILTDERVTKQIPFVFFLAFLGLILITNRNSAEKTIRKIEVLQDSIKELRSESITISAELMQISKPSEVIEKVRDANIGLEEPVNPPQKLIIKKDK